MLARWHAVQTPSLCKQIKRGNKIDRADDNDVIAIIINRVLCVSVWSLQTIERWKKKIPTGFSCLQSENHTVNDKSYGLMVSMVFWVHFDRTMLFQCFMALKILSRKLSGILWQIKQYMYIKSIDKFHRTQMGKSIAARCIESICWAFSFYSTISSE